MVPPRQLPWTHRVTTERGPGASDRLKATGQVTGVGPLDSESSAPPRLCRRVGAEDPLRRAHTHSAELSSACAHPAGGRVCCQHSKGHPNREDENTCAHPPLTLGSWALRATTNLPVPDERPAIQLASLTSTSPASSTDQQETAAKPRSRAKDAGTSGCSKPRGQVTQQTSAPVATGPKCPPKASKPKQLASPSGRQVLRCPPAMANLKGFCFCCFAVVVFT